MNRTGWLAVVALGLLGAGVAARLAWPSARPALDCPPEQVRWVDRDGARVAACDRGLGAGVVPAGPALTVGVRLDLNRASEADLALLPGVGPALARRLVEARGADGGFRTWDEIDAVEGVGPAKLETLRTLGRLEGD